MVIGLLRVQHGEVAAAQAREMATMVEVSRRTLAGLPEELAGDVEFVDGLAEMQIGAALACTSNAAAIRYRLKGARSGRAISRSHHLLCREVGRRHRRCVGLERHLGPAVVETENHLSGLAGERNHAGKEGTAGGRLRHARFSVNSRARKLPSPFA